MRSGLIAVGMTYTIAAILGAGSPSLALPAGAAATALGAVVTCALALLVQGRRIFGDLDRRASWTVVSASGILWLSQVPAPSRLDGDRQVLDLAVFVAGLALYPLVVWGLLTLPRNKPGRLALTIFGLDLAIVSWAAAMILWHLLLYPLGRGAGANQVEIVLQSIAPSADLGLVLLAIALLRVPMRGVGRGPKLLLMLAFAFEFATDLGAAMRVLAPGQTVAALPDLPRLWFWVMCGCICLELMGQRDAADAESGERSLSFSWLPYIAIAVAFVVPAVSSWGDVGMLEQHVPASGVLIVLVLLRLAAMSRQNGALVASGAARRTEARFHTLVQNASDLVVLTDVDSRIRYLTPSIATMLGYPPATIDGTLFADLLHPDDAPMALAGLADVATAAGATRSAEWRLRRADGSFCETEVLLSNLLDVPEVGGLVLTARDIGERKSLERELKFQALHDPLTGLANRTLFADRVEHALAGSRRRHGAIAVLYLDVDDFKRINDGHGHGIGDRLLIEIAARIAAVFRSGDTVARLGGDEFGVLLEDLQVPDEAQHLAERVIDILRAPFDVGGIEAFVSVTIGVAVGSGAELDQDELLRNADVAMYVAKANGKRRFETFDPSMHRSVRDRLVLEADLRRAVSRNEFEVYYQPVWATDTRRMVGVEALVRWRHPTRGLLAPAEFIGAAEDTGLIVPIGRLVLRQACAQTAAWDRAGGSQAGLSVAVNLSPRQLREADLVEMVATALADSGLAATRLNLEITEAVLVDDSPAMAKLLRQLKALGLRISIDDFGTGYSSLSYLRRLPIDTLKIAKPFVDVVTHGERDEALAQAIVSLARSLELEVVAEGVEDEAQLHTLFGMGCELGQGYLVSPPVPADRLPASTEAATATRHAA